MPILIFLIKALSFLPMNWLYAICRIGAFKLEFIIGYRKAVIKENIKLSFPEKTDEEIKAIAHKYYIHLGKLIAETIKLQSISASEIQKQCSFINPEVLENATTEGKPIIILMGHSGNWEWAGLATQLRFSFNMRPVYRKLKNKAFNEFYFKLRSRFGVIPLVDKDFTLSLATDKGNAFALLADQIPASRRGIWLNFLNQDTLVYRGPELISKRHPVKVVFAHVRRGKEGNYNIFLKDDQGGDGLTNRFWAFLESEINVDPVNWLWSHRRWKVKKPDHITPASII